MGHGSGSAIVNAVAGSGKTKLIELSLPHIPEHRKVQLFAFNTTIAKELNARIDKLRASGERPYANVRASTFHSVGFGAICRHLGKRANELTTDGNKLRKLCDAWLGRDEQKMYGEYVCKLVGLAKGEGVAVLVPDAVEQWDRLIRHHDLYLDSEDADEANAIRLARDLLGRSNEAGAKGSIDFDDMLYLPLLWRLRLFQNDWVLTDEAQDTNPCRRAMAKLALKPGGRAIFVGDPRQCQPPGTMVCVTGRGEVPIEELKRGDRLLTYANGYFPGKNSQGRLVEAVASREYRGELIRIEAGRVSHEVTPNHRALVRMAHRQGSIVYVMRKGDHARIGRCDASYGGGFGLASRCGGEKADAAWIIGFFPEGEDDEARLVETSLAYEYRLPQLTFEYNERGEANGSKIRKRFWYGFPSNILDLNDCLKVYGLYPELPFWERGSGKHIGRLYAFELYAANLVSGWMDVCTFDGNPHTPTWSTAKISRRHYEGPVYSLKVEPNEVGRRLYVANGIVTHNSIYGFTGASADAMEIIRHEFDAVEMPLSVCYRCGTSIVAKAREIVGHIEPHDAAPEGLVETLPLAKALDVLGPHDAVLCRKNAPLVSLAFRLIGQKRGCVILGRDIGSGLVSLIKRMKADDVDDLDARLQRHLDREVPRYMARGEEGKAEAVTDRVACIRAVIENLGEDDRSIDALAGYLESMFRDTNGVLTLSSVHKAKGKEWERVAVLEPEAMPSPFARQDWQRAQERNLMYVCYTRAMRHLIFLTG